MIPCFFANKFGNAGKKHYLCIGNTEVFKTLLLETEKINNLKLKAMANYFDVVDCRTGRVVDTLDYHGARREASRWNNASPYAKFKVEASLKHREDY